MSMHDDQVPLAPSIVAQLVRAQFPQWSTERISPVESAGTTNYLFRIGDNYVARFPLLGTETKDVYSSIVAEQKAMYEFAAASTVASPEPVVVGEPGFGYPLPWSVQTWLEGEVATPTSEASSAQLTEDLSRLIGALRLTDTRGRQFSGNGRGGDLASHDEWVSKCLGESRGLLPVDRLERAWSTLRTIPRVRGDVMSHKDLIPGNLLVNRGRLVGVLDTGDFGPADPALDLVAAWHLLDSDGRSLLRRILAVDELEWRRGAAWALQQALGLVWYYADSNPGMSALGWNTLGRLLSDPDLAL